MSAFLVSDKTITKILDGIARPHPWIWDSARMHDAPPKRFDELGAELLMMNHRALKERYGDEMPKSVAYRYPSQWGSTTPIETYKAIQCFLYQCCEGTVDESPLYKRVEQWQREVGSEIIRQLPEYDNTPWDF